MLRLFAFFLSFFLLSSPLDAREDIAVCGSHPDRLKEELQLHRKAVNLRTLRGLFPASVVRTPAAGRDAGEIALIEDTDGVVSRRNAFDLDGRTLNFIPVAEGASRYRFETGGSSYDAGAASRGRTITQLQDDDARKIDLPFALPFYGRTHRSVYVHSDGNLTFEAPDASSSSRSLGRVIAGPARIAALFRDLDPSQSPVGVRVLEESNRLVVSWVEVPEFSEVGSAPRQTFQVRLFPDGRIEVAFQLITTRDAVVGIAPGNLRGSSAVVAFSEGSSAEYSSAIVERFTDAEELDIVVTAQKFYETHEDAYDYLVIFNDQGIRSGPSSIAFEVTLRNSRTGYGDVEVDGGREFGSARRLQSVLNMGPLSQYPLDPFGVVSGRAAARDTPLTILGHEAGHLFLAFASVREPGNPAARPMLGRQGAHWNFSFNSEASFIEGNRICDRERQSCPGFPGSGRFVTTATVEGYSLLDQYLMGFRPASEVPPTFLVTNSTITNSSRMPQAGVSFDGMRRDISIEEIAAAEGRRTPDHTVSQRRFRFAFILVVGKGGNPSQAAIDQVDRYRREFEGFYRAASGQNAWADTTLRRLLHMSAFPASGVLLGSSAPAKVSVAAPLEGDLTILLSSQSGAVRVPASVTIRAGSSEAAFEISGVRPGVDEVTAEVPGALYNQAHAKVQVAGGASELRLRVVGGDRQLATPGVPLPEPVVVKVTDINDLPYPGVRLSASPAGGGRVEPSLAVSDDRGEVRFVWIPGAEPLNELRVSADGASLSATITAVGQPFFTTGGVVNSATFAPNLSPGSMASIFGANLAAGAAASAGLPLPAVLAGVQVLVNDLRAPLIYVSDRQINFVVPLEVGTGEAEISVSTRLGRSSAVRVPLSTVSPGIFLAGGDRFGAVSVAGTGQLTSERPALPGEVVEIYATGLGPVRLRTGTGLFETTFTPQVTIVGLPATVRFSGLAPGWLGFYQVNVVVPPGALPGTQPLRLAIADAPANEVLVRLR